MMHGSNTNFQWSSHQLNVEQPQPQQQPQQQRSSAAAAAAARRELSIPLSLLVTPRTATSTSMITPSNSVGSIASLASSSRSRSRLTAAVGVSSSSSPNKRSKRRSTTRRSGSSTPPPSSASTVSSMTATSSSSSLTAPRMPRPLWTKEFAADITSKIQHPRRTGARASSSSSSSMFWDDLTPRDIIGDQGGAGESSPALLGSGAFSNVTRVRIQRSQDVQDRSNGSNSDQQSPCYYALKTLKRSLLPQDSSQVSASRRTMTMTRRNPNEDAAEHEDAQHDRCAMFVKAAQELAKEADLLAHLDEDAHPHIIKICGWTTGGTAAYDTYRRHDAFFLVLELLQPDTLEDRIQQWNTDDLEQRYHAEPRPPQDDDRHHHDRTMEKLTICAQMANALDYIHSKNIVYRDLKPQNVGFAVPRESASKNNTVHVKLMDFGLARELSSSAERICDEPGIGTIRYMAPEVYIPASTAAPQDNDAAAGYGIQADIYSWSIVCYELLTQALPFANMSPRQYLQYVCHYGVRPNSWNNMTGTVIEHPLHQTTLQHDGRPILPEHYLVLLANAWRTDPSKRLSLHQIEFQLDLFLQKEELEHEAKQLQQRHDNDLLFLRSRMMQQQQQQQQLLCHALQQQQMQQQRHRSFIPPPMVLPSSVLDIPSEAFQFYIPPK